jgi:hypothetical protein
MQPDDQPYGYDYNRIADALNGLRTGDVTISALAIDGLLTALVYTDDVDVAHPMYIDYFSTNGITPNPAWLSFKLRKYRTTTSTTSNAGSAHHHTHGHSLPVAGNAINVNSFLGFDGGGNFAESDVTGATVHGAYNTAPTNNDATDESGHTHTSSLGVVEDTTTTITNLLVDGVDKTSVLGGPWTTDQVQINLAGVLPTGDGHYHTIQLTPSSRGRIISILQVPM